METLQEFKGTCFGIRLKIYGEGRIGFICLVEDDGIWHERPHMGSTFWLSELRDQINLALDYLDNSPLVEEYEWGYRLKEDK